MNILIINCGSSSIKFQFFDMNKNACLAKGIAERIGQNNSYLIYEKRKKVLQKKLALKDYYIAIDTIVSLLTSKDWGVIKNKEKISAVGHRIVHGAEEFKTSAIIDKYVLNRINHYGKLAPLHNPPAYNGIKAAIKILPKIKQVAVFDTAFHQTLPATAYVYGLPYRLYKKYFIRRYGFHGTSHRYVADLAAKILGKPLTKLKLITCHLGNGCSITAIKNGRSIDTSMGFTPLEGLIMGTRCGDIDPALIFFIMEKEKLNAKQVDDLLNRQSGLLGISGISNDMRDLLRQAKEGNSRAKLAIENFYLSAEKIYRCLYGCDGRS